MRTKMQQAYDRLYHTAELNIFRFYRNLHKFQATRGLPCGRDFQKAYREKVLPYWKKYGLRPKRFWYKFFYSLTGEVDPRYIPDDIHHRYIIPYFDDVEYIRALEDKNLHSVLFRDVLRPETVFKYSSRMYCNDDFSPISRQEALGRCLAPGRYIIKPARDTGEGMDIRFFAGEDGPEAIAQVLDQYTNIDHLVQRVLTQHPALAAFNPTSVNTLRVVTMVHREKAHILSAIMRIGNTGSLVDNISKGGYQAVIRPDGTLGKYAYTHKDGKDIHVERTDAGMAFEGFQIPHWADVRQTALELALRLPHLRLIGWDFTVDEQGRVVMIEFNCDFGQNQENCGPTFGDMTDDILDDIFINKRKDLLT